MSAISEQTVGLAPPDENLADWLSQYLGDEMPTGSKCEVVEYPSAGGLSAEMRMLKVYCPDGEVKSYVYKSTVKGREDMSKQLGILREAFFYKNFADLFKSAGAIIPRVYYVYGSTVTGSKAILMEDLSSVCVQSGYYFGAYSPLNWGKDLPKLISRDGKVSKPPTLREVASITFQQIARVHSKFWKSESLLQHQTLRGVDWIRGEGQLGWEASQNSSRTTWAAAKAKIEDGSTPLKWNDNLIACMDSSISKANFDVFREDIKTRAWTLVHGDFHPANVMWHEADESNPAGYPLLLDWEMVGLGNGPQDIAQYFISHTCPSDRKECEMDLLREYYASLTATATISSAESGGVSPDAYSWDECLSDYVQGGACRWVWLFAFLTSICPPPVTQYFHDQLASFLDDHGVTPENIGMPRV